MAVEDVRQDMYKLGQSEEKSIQDLAEEIRLDLQLQPNENLEGGTVYGKVVDEEGNPIENSLVKIMSNDYEPLAHAFTAADGSYVFSPFPAGNNYRIFAISDGYKLQEQIQFNLLSNQQVEKNFQLEVDPNASNGIIAGDIFDNTTGQPIEGAVVKLYQVDDQQVETLYALTYTNEYGQYVFRELEQDNYIVRITALGYQPAATNVVIDQPGQIANVISNLQVDTATERGTVSGLITDDNNQPIAQADVILYEVKEDDSLNPVAFTKTNDQGAYLFINVARGDYKIKSNKMVDITV
ncbi:carboxypeptidase-like regulatory domain-containing protein [Clostridium oceanicum]|uniref:Cna protein B-type domain protein n=1 Tax=Clostridium oceanicum TaxID=1543 RepID=A0ABP3V1Q0_9CLOT